MDELPKLKTERSKLLRRAAGFAAKLWWAEVRGRFPKNPPEDRREHFARAAIRAGRIANGEPVIRKPIPGLCNSMPDSDDKVIIEMCDLPKGHARSCQTRNGGHMWWYRHVNSPK